MRGNRRVVPALFAWSVVGLLGTAPAYAEQPQVKPADLTAAITARIDQIAAGTSLEELPQQKQDFSQDIRAWLISRMPLKPEEEFEQAQAAHAELIQKVRVVATPPEVRQVLQTLLENLPPHLRPAPFEFSVTVVDLPEINAFTVGGGFLYLSKPLLNLLLEDPAHGRDMLAFVLAHELGHVAEKHCRYGYKNLLLQEEFEKGNRTGFDKTKLGEVLQTTLNPPGSLVKFVYTRRQEYEADLTAMHLCRNAGIRSEGVLDAIRLLCLVRYPQILSDPEFKPQPDAPSSALPYYLASHPDALLRLKRLQMELAGTLDDDEGYGLLLFDPQNDALTQAADQSLAAGQRAVVFLHGMEGDVHGKKGNALGYLDLMDLLAQQAGGKNIRLFAFRYPNDQSLSRSGKYFSNELRRVFGSCRNVDFVCHSAGGLVFRYYSEVLNGEFRKAVFQGTPHGGSELASLQALIEAAQFFGNLKLGYPEAVGKSILDGRGQIIDDLHPSSLFLHYLGRFDKPTDRYFIFRGQVLRPPQALALKGTVRMVRTIIQREIDKKVESPLLRKSGLQFAELLKLPSEIGEGDLAVSLQSAELPGVAHIVTTPEHHLALKSDPDVMQAVVRILLAEE